MARSRWKRPITKRACASCGEAVRARYAKYCGPCRAAVRARWWVEAKKYVWTPERDQFLRGRYDSKVKGRAAAIGALWGWPTWAIKRRASHLGLCHPRAGHQDWTPEEVSFLEANVGRRTIIWMARRLKRSETSVVLKIKRMGISRRWREGMTLRGLEECFGVDHHAIDRWIRNGWLRGRRRGTNSHHDAWVFTDEDVIEFIRQHPMEFRLDKADQLCFMDLVLGGGLLRTESSRGDGLSSVKTELTRRSA